MTLLRPLKFTLIFILVAAVLFVAATLFLKFSLTRGRTEDYASFESRIMLLEKDYLSSKINELASDIIYLTYTYEVYSGIFDSKSYTQLEQNWSAFLRGRDAYYKLRYIDTAGYERIKLTFSQTDGIRISPPFELENKADRYYLKDAKSLRNNQIYLSKFDLNVDNNEISLPYQLTLRLVSPVYSASSALQGYIVLSCDAVKILTSLKDIAKASSGVKLLLNREGQWLMRSDRGSFEWGYMSETGNSFKDEQPEIWEEINKAGSGELVTEKGLYVFMTSPPYNVKKVDGDILIYSAEGPFILVSFIPNNLSGGLMFSSDLHALIHYAFGNEYILLIIAAVISALIVFLIAVIQSEKKKKKLYQYDALSGAYNRGTGFELLEKTYARLLGRHKKGIKVGLTVCFIDINGLKDINDSRGHEAGDRLISDVSGLILREIVNRGFLMRIGGDEFLIVLPETGLKEAENIWQRIQEGFNLSNKGREDGAKISVSHGLAEFTFEPGETIDTVINLADEMMYTEKKITRSVSRKVVHDDAY